MKNIIISWLAFTILFVIKLQCVLSDQICYRLENLKPICKTDNGKLIQYKPVFKSLNKDRIQYVGHSINVIRHHAFIEYEDNLQFQKYMKVLVLDLSDADTIIEPSAIALTKLERLEINSGPVQLELNSFQNLSNLQHLKIKVNEKSAKIGQVLKNLPQLKSLELLDNYNISICDSSDDLVQIKILQYTGGFIERLSSKSFECLTNLEELTITETSLSMIEPGAFNLLEKIKKISITGNDKFNIIPANIFDNIIELKILDLSNNSILKLDNTYLTMSKNCELLNLSYNSIEFIENGFFKNIKCITLDLGGNEIKFIANNEFKNSIIHTILLDENFIEDSFVEKRWGIDDVNTKIYFHYDYVDYAVFNSQQENQKLNCYGSKCHYFEICRKKNQLISVAARAMPDRLLQETLIFEDTDIILTKDYIFDNLKIKNLIIQSTAKPFHLIAESLKGLPKLENLQLDTYPILIKNTTFFYIKNTLQRLSLSVIESQIFLCDSIQEIKNLMSLTIVNHDAFNFCNEICNEISSNLKLKKLHYQKGSFRTVPSNAFSCLKNLQYLFIDNTRITGFENDAFNGLDSLVTLLLQYNRNLKYIQKNSFSHLTNLKILLLTSNSIEFIEDGAFSRLNNYLSLLDLSQNKLHVISDRTFEGISSIKQLDLSNNDIINFKYDPHLISLVYAYNNTKLFVGSKKVQVELSCYVQNWWTICISGTIATSITLNIIDPFWEISDEEKDNSQMDITIDNITLIRDDAWKNIDTQVTIKSLIINKNFRDGLKLPSNSFDGLSKLENLELNVGPTILERGAFYRLSKMNRLKIEVDITERYLGKSLMNLKRLTSLNIVKNKSISICDNKYSLKLPPLLYLSYTKGPFTILHKKSFICLPSLQSLRVTKTNLTTIEPDAFFGLDLLEKINLSYNKIKRIVIDVFNSLKVLKELRLNNNEIISFDRGSLITVNNNYTLINVSYNKIVDIPEKTFGNLVCQVFDIRKNPLQSSPRTIMGFPAIIGELIDRLGHRNYLGQHFKALDDEPRRKYSRWMSHGKDCHGKFILFGSKYGSTCRKISPYTI